MAVAVEGALRTECLDTTTEFLHALVLKVELGPDALLILLLPNSFLLILRLLATKWHAEFKGRRPLLIINLPRTWPNSMKAAAVACEEHLFVGDQALSCHGIYGLVCVVDEGGVAHLDALYFIRSNPLHLPLNNIRLRIA